MAKLLSVNERFIRALAAKLWMRINRENDFDILERIFNETHPAVAESVFQSAMKGWHLYSAERQHYVLNALERIASQPVLANAIIQLLVIFEREHATGDTPLAGLCSVISYRTFLSDSNRAFKFCTPRSCCRRSSAKTYT
ncbi:hypothetical protein LNO81_30420 [Klebsiella variicola subsp. variicola]|nr:hypothetical protein [Klebsiella variicola subsp. variicola]